MILMSCAEQESPRVVEKFTKDWLFMLGDSSTYSAEDFDDEDWRHLNLPHDWSIEGDFAENNPSGCGGGALPGGIGWYRKHFNVNAADLEGHVYITFDGVYMNSTVYVNGKKVGYRPYGYISFNYDITKYLNRGANVIAVRVDNSKQPNSRWYSGSGIYRNVWITKVGKLHISNWGIYVTTPLVSDDKAMVKIRTAYDNTTFDDMTVKIVHTIYDKLGHKVVSESAHQDVLADSKGANIQQVRVDNPHLWSVEDPYLYSLVTEFYVHGTLCDSYTTQIGIRNAYFDSEEGFLLNGKPLKINGVCLHHDLGCLGAAINKRAMERQLQIMKNMGCNAIRCSHNPPAPEFLQLCDSMGFIVMDEAFDMWRKRKTDYDYSTYFNEWHERDLTDMVLRDRNHPSIFIWSIGNEVLEQWTHADADTLDIQTANLLLNMQRDRSSLANDEQMSVNSLLCKKLANIVHTLDPTRPVTSGNNEPDPANHLFRANALDLIGYNYHDSYFDDVPTLFPGMPFIVTESVSALMTRGYYLMPSDHEYIWPERWDLPFNDPSFSCSSYDNCRAPWGNTHERTLKKVMDNKFICGQFIWTGFDYIGEPTPYWWPARSSYFGIVDLAGFPKDVYYLYKSVWSDETVLHLFPHWNWKDGDMIDLWCYYNNADEVELYVNGKSLGAQRKNPGALHVAWNVEYEPGEIKVISRKDGVEVAHEIIKTSGRPAQIRLTADRSRIKADGEDLSFVTVEVLDRDGNLCPNAENDIHFDIEGVATIAGVDNGSPISHERFKDNHRKVFYGKALVVLQSKETPGNVRLIATSEHLKSAEVTINCLPSNLY
ncbi:MAG: glycoside hydrolase family 2 protein [Bacteroidales bacterium]|nr:glycoside hydrolase family 2 protein [Bacteroidales bacterium]